MPENYARFKYIDDNNNKADIPLAAVALIEADAQTGVKLINKGDDNTPVKFVNGVPEPCNGVATKSQVETLGDRVTGNYTDLNDRVTDNTNDIADNKTGIANNSKSIGNINTSITNMKSNNQKVKASIDSNGILTITFTNYE